MIKLKQNQKISIVFDDSGDQIERFPNGYYIATVLEHNHEWGWFNPNIGTFHIAKLADLNEHFYE